MLTDAVLILSLVPDQTPEKVDELVAKHVAQEFEKLKTKNKIHLEPLHGGKPWVTDPDHWNYTAARIATKVSVVCGPSDGSELTVYSANLWARA